MKPTPVVLEARTESSVASATLSFEREMGKVSRQSSVFFAGTLFTTGAGYLFKIYVARKLGAEPLGLYALGMSVVSFLGLFAGMGLPDTAARFVAVYNGTGQADRLRGFIRRSLSLVLVVGCALGLLMVAGRGLIAEHFYHEPALAKYIPLFALMLPISVVSYLFSQTLAGYHDVARRTIVSSFIGVPLTIVLTLVLLNMGWAMWGYLIPQVISAIVTLGLMGRGVWQLTSRAAKARDGTLSGLEPGVISFAVSMIGMGILGFLLGETDRVVLGVYLDAKQIGIYSIAASIAIFIPVLLQSVNSIFGPVIADLHARGERDVLSRMFQTLTKWILGLTSPLVMIVVLFAPALMGVFGAEFRSGWPVLVIMTLGQLVNCGVGSVGFLLKMSGNQNTLIKVQAVMGAVTLLSNLLLIPVLGLIGAATVGGISAVVTNVMYLSQVRRKLGLYPYNSSYFRLLGALLASAAVTLLLRWRAGTSERAQLLMMLVAFACSYGAFVFATLKLGLADDDRLIAGLAWRRARGMLRGIKVGPSL